MDTEIAKLQHREQLRELVDSYASAVDARDAQSFASLFTHNGQLSIYEPGVTDPVISFSGTEELMTVVELLQGFENTFHLMANHSCSIEDNQATGEVYCLANHIVSDGATMSNLCMYIRYQDEYQLTDQGWRFAHRRVMRQWTEERPADLKPLDLSGVQC